MSSVREETGCLQQVGCWHWKVFYRKEETYDGWFCKQCGLALYEHVMKRHLANTCRSPTSLIFGATIGTGVNLLAKNKLMSLAEPLAG